MTRPLRIAHVVFDLDRGGMETVLVDLTRAVSERPDVEVSVLILSGETGRAAQAIAPFVKRLTTFRPFPVLSMIWPRRVAAWLRESEADVVHLHSGSWFKPAWAARLAGIRGVIYTEHGRKLTRSIVRQVFDSIAARLTSQMVSVSPLITDGLARESSFSSSAIQVIINGVDTQRFVPRHNATELRASLGFPTDACLIGSVGRFEFIKGSDVMLDAFELLLESWPNNRPPYLAMVGEGSMLPQLQMRVASSPLLTKYARILPWVSDPSVLYPAFDLFVMASRSEGTSISLLEAMSCGVCPVVTDVGGNAHVLGGELAHRLVPSENPPSLAAGISAALSGDADRGRDARAARDRVISDFSLNAMAEHYLALYRKLARR